MKNVILIAPPAAGKGSISNYLINNLGYTHIGTGDILRNVAKEDTEIGKKVNELMQSGKLIGDDIILPLFKNELIKLKDKPFILDGIPRNINQGEYLEKIFEEIGVNNYIVININIDLETLEKRVTGRRVCTNCGSIYNINFDEFKPKVEDTCDDCSSTITLRNDDNIETFTKRYETYLNETAPLIKFYQEKDLLKIVDAKISSTELIKNVKDILLGENND